MVPSAIVSTMQLERILRQETMRRHGLGVLIDGIKINKKQRLERF